MIRATTHTVKFDCIDVIEPEDSVRHIEISFSQENNPEANIVRHFAKDENGEITVNDCYLDDQTKIISTVLTPAETLLFTDKRKAKVQLRILMWDVNGRPYILGNYIQMITVYPTQSESFFGVNFLGGVANG